VKNMTARLSAAVGLLLALATPAAAQTTVTCSTPTSCTITASTFPVPVSVAWNADGNTPTCTVTGYNVYVNNAIAANVAATAVQASVSLPSAATYTLALTATSAPTTATSGATCTETAKSAPITVLLQQSQIQTQIPAVPTGFHVVIPGSTPTAGGCAAPSPFGTTATTITDPACRVWTLSGTGTVLVNGSPANGTAAGSLFVLQPSGIYVLGLDNNWYLATLLSDGVTWSFTNVGTTKPSA
jgi:hypothetical protein